MAQAAKFVFAVAVFLQFARASSDQEDAADVSEGSTDVQYNLTSIEFNEGASDGQEALRKADKRGTARATSWP
jgi:hypothetical protein